MSFPFPNFVRAMKYFLFFIIFHIPYQTIETKLWHDAYKKRQLDTEVYILLYYISDELLW